jgi:hypothetical protein
MVYRLYFTQPDYRQTGFGQFPERHAGLGSGIHRSDEQLLVVRQSVVLYEKKLDTKRLSKCHSGQSS